MAPWTCSLSRSHRSLVPASAKPSGFAALVTLVTLVTPHCAPAHGPAIPRTSLPYLTRTAIGMAVGKARLWYLYFYNDHRDHRDHNGFYRGFSGHVWSLKVGSGHGIHVEQRRVA